MLLVIYCLLLHCVQHGHRAQTLLFDLRSGGTGGGYAQAVPSAQCLLVPYFSGYMCLCPCSTISVFFAFRNLQCWDLWPAAIHTLELLGYLHQQYFSE